MRFRRRFRRRRGRGTSRRLKRYVNNAITARKNPKQRFEDYTTQNPAGVLSVTRIGNGITKGTDRGNRIGDSIELKGIKFRIELTNQHTNILKICVVRFILAFDREPHINQAINFFKGEGSTTNVPDDYIVGGDYDQVWKPINRRRWGIIFDKKIKVHPRASAEVKWKKNFTIYVPMRTRIKYNDDSADTDYLKPNLNLIWFSEFADSNDVDEFNVDIKITTFFRD